MRTEMKMIDIIKKPHYRNIFRLTLAFQNKENGLQSKHYRYALVKSDKNKKKKSLFYLESFFLDANGNDLLEKLYKSGKIQKDCITGDNLKNFLKLMVDKGILEIVNSDEKNKRYKVTITFLNAQSKDWIKNEIDKWKNIGINPMHKIIDMDSLNLSDEQAISSYLYGFPTDSLFLDRYLIHKHNVEIVRKKMLCIHKDIIDITKIICRYDPDGIGVIGFFIKSAIQPQLKEQFKIGDETMEQIKSNMKNMKTNFRG